MRISFEGIPLTPFWEMREAEAAHALELNIRSKRADRYLLACAIACAALCVLIWRR